MTSDASPDGLREMVRAKYAQRARRVADDGRLVSAFVRARKPAIG